MILKRETSQMLKSDGINSDTGIFCSEDIEGDFVQIEAPDNWQQVLMEASDNTANMTPLTLADLGKKSDWLWWENEEIDDQGYLNGVSWLCAQWID